MIITSNLPLPYIATSRQSLISHNTKGYWIPNLEMIATRKNINKALQNYRQQCKEVYWTLFLQTSETFTNSRRSQDVNQIDYVIVNKKWYKSLLNVKNCGEWMWASTIMVDGCGHQPSPGNRQGHLETVIKTIKRQRTLFQYKQASCVKGQNGVYRWAKESFRYIQKIKTMRTLLLLLYYITWTIPSQCFNIEI